MSELRDFTKAAAAQFGFDATQDDDVVEDELETGVDDDEAEGGAEEQGPGGFDYDQVAAAFWESLDPASRDAAKADEDVREELWRAFLESQELAVTDDEDGAEADAGGEAPSSAREMVEAILSGEVVPTDEDGRPVDPMSWLRWVVSAPPSEWRAAAAAVGWPVDARPSRALLNEYGKTVQGEIFAADWAAHLADLKARGRHIGGY